MKKIYFRKTLEYDPTCGGKYDRYEGYCRITGGLEDPGIIATGKTISPIQIEQIFCSPARRARESARNGYMVLGELEEIRFKLNKLVSRDEFIVDGGEVVRKRFLAMFINNKLGESRSRIKLRTDCLIGKIKGLPEGEYLLISHSFFMKVLEAYLNQKDLFEKPRKLSDYLNPRNRTYNFGEGFEFEI